MQRKREEHHAPMTPFAVRIHFAGYDRHHAVGRIRMLRNYHLFHYVLSGHGSVAIDGREWSLTRGSGFFFFPGQYHDYGADADDPWGYAWIAFDGADAKALLTRIGISKERPIFTRRYSPAVASLMESIVTELGAKRAGYDLSVHAKFFSLFSMMAGTRGVSPSDTDANAHESPRVRSMLSYISSHLNGDCTVRAAAESAGLDETYGSKLFKRATGQTMRDYILSLRIGSAKNMLRSSRMDVAGIAEAAGFHEYAVFARLFRRKTGMTPTQFRATKKVW
ncbi:MAG: AraC family ligand binding domain-containing protein [Spirochaetota bacterium]